jgi:hypothetical protein
MLVRSPEAGPMPLYRLLEKHAFDPSLIEAMAYAFEAICHNRQLLPGRHDLDREVVAQKIIECAQRGECDPIKLRQAVEAILVVKQ